MACCGGGGISRSKTEAAAPSTCVDGLPTVCGHSCGATVMLMQRVCATIAGSIGGGVGVAFFVHISWSRGEPTDSPLQKTEEASACCLLLLPLIAL